MPFSTIFIQKIKIHLACLAEKRRLYFYPALTCLLIISFLAASREPLNAQSYLFDAQMLTPENGLANITATSIFKDRQGFIWIGTAYGLNRYDGYNFKLFTREKNALQYDGASAQINEDASGKLWLFYRGGYFLTPSPNTINAVDIFDPVTEQAVPLDTFFFGNLPFRVNEICLPRVHDPQNRLWIHTKKGALFLYANNRFKKVFQQEGAFFSHITIDQKENIWLARDNHLMAIDTLGNVLEKTELPDQIIGIYTGQDQAIRIPIRDTANLNISIWEKTQNGALRPLVLKRDGRPVALNKKAPFLYLHQKGFWFARIDEQLHLFDAQGQWLFNYNTILPLNTNVGFSSCYEHGNRLWLASPTGVIKVSVRENPFKLIHRKDDKLSDCRSITEDELGNLYFLNSHILQWDKKTQQCRKLSDPVFAYALLYSDSTVWASTYGGGPSTGCDLDLRTKKVTNYPPLNPNKSLVLSLAKTDDPKRFLVGMHPGLAYLDLRQKKILPFNEGPIESATDSLLESSAVNFIHKNGAGYWLATDKGIFLVKTAMGGTLHFNKSGGDLPFNYIRHIYEDKDGVFWLATKGGGIIRWPLPSIDEKGGRYRKPAERYRQFTTEDGLSDNFTYAVYEDKYGKLWIPSDKGLMRMDKTSFDLQTFTREDGLPHNEFNFAAHYQAKDGTLYFGGLGGLIALDPTVFTENDISSTPMAFIGCYVLEGNTDKLTDKTQLLRESNTIRINPGDKFLELHFALLDHDKVGQHRYAYQIEGYSDNWNYIDENFIRITHLPYGDYTLLIRGWNSSRGWSERELSLPVCVVRPFYLRWWFIMLLLLLLGGTILAAVRWRIMELKKGKKRLEAEVRRRTRQLEEQYRQMETDKQTIAAQAEALQELDKAKTHFFSNITHEFRTPLTLITGPLEQVMSEQALPTIFKRRLSGVLKNARHLLTLINQLLDLSKIEGKQMKVEATRGDIVSYTKDIIGRFQPLAQKKEQGIHFLSPFKHWETVFDRDKWDKILYNLLSNAIKFTHARQDIQVSLLKTHRNQKDYLRLDVKDSGIGIDSTHLSQIFNRFYQADSASTRTQGGTGIGLALVKELIELQGGEIRVSSEVNKGTSFEVYLPVLEEAPVRVWSEEPLSEYAFPFIPEEPDGTTAFDPVAGMQPKLELLLIEDNAELREYIRYCIDPARYNITEAADGEEGIEKAQALVPDLIISDVMMPKKDGFEVAKAVRSHVATSHIPLILLTARASLESRLEGLQRGADAYLTKPFSPQELALRIQKLIEIRRLLQQRYNQDFQPQNDGLFQQEDEFITALRSFILEHLDEPDLDGDRVGRHVGLSRVSLYRKLNALTEQSISEFVRSIRLNKALELIREGKLNLSEIAYQTGFSSISAFSRAFKQAYGKAPSGMKG